MIRALLPPMQRRARRIAALIAALSLLTFSGPAWSQEAASAPVLLRTPVAASGPALKLGDVLTIEGPAAAQEIAPAPRSGQTSTYPLAVIAAAARAAGIDWTPPPGLISIEVAGPDASQRASAAATLRGAGSAPRSLAPVIKRGDIITLHYQIGALSLSARARALANAAAGEPVRLVNVDSERPIDAVAIGPGQATVSTP